MNKGQSYYYQVNNKNMTGNGVSIGDTVRIDRFETYLPGDLLLIIQPDLTYAIKFTEKDFELNMSYVIGKVTRIISCL